MLWMFSYKKKRKQKIWYNRYMHSKKCTRCLNNKACTEFYADRYAKDGYSSACRKCRSKQIAKASKRRKLQGKVSDEARSLTESNYKCLNLYLNDYRIKNLKYLVIPVWLKGAFQPNIGGVFLNQQGNGAMFLNVYTQMGGTHYAICDYSVEHLSETLTSQGYEILSPESVTELNIAGLKAI